MHKLSLEELKKMNCKELSAHIDEITQTPICKDKEYCKILMMTFLEKPLSTARYLNNQLELF